MTTAADQLATLLAMPRAPEPPDRRSQEQIDHDSAREQIAEDRQWMRENPTEAESEWAARRYAG